MRQRTALAPLGLSGTAPCSEAPTGPRSELRARGASGNAAVEGGGMFGSNHGSVTTSTDSETASDSISGVGRGGVGMFGSGH